MPATHACQRARSRLRRPRVTLLAVATVLCPALAAAYSSYGLGTLECRTYLERRGEDQRAGTMQNTAYIHAFLSGYLTAGNTLHGLVGEHAKDVALNVHTVVQWLDAWCLDHGEQRIAAALEHFWVEAAAAKEKLKALGPGTARRLPEE